MKKTQNILVTALILISNTIFAQTTFKDYKTYKGGKTDFIGIDDGTRAIPGGLPTTKDFSNVKLDQIEYAKMVNYDWSMQTKKALPNYNFQYSLANVGKIFKRYKRYCQN